MKIREIAFVVALLAFCSTLYADGTKNSVEVTNKYRFAVEMELKLAKGLKLALEPQVQFMDGYDNLRLNGGLSYKTFGCIYWGAAYRLEVDRVEGSGSSSNQDYGMLSFLSNEYDSQLHHRYAFDVTFKQRYHRFTPSFRLQYNNFTEEDSGRAYFRYRAKVGYDIPKCKFTPSLSIEAFQELEDNMLYKTRYCADVDYKINKRAAISLSYKFDYFNLKYKNTNIFSLGFKFSPKAKSKE